MWRKASPTDRRPRPARRRSRAGPTPGRPTSGSAITSGAPAAPPADAAVAGPSRGGPVRTGAAGLSTWRELTRLNPFFPRPPHALHVHLDPLHWEARGALDRGAHPTDQLLGHVCDAHAEGDDHVQ